jgi:MFS family permease
VTAAGTAGRPSKALRRVLVPLALAQFICSFAGSNMNVMITDMSEDLDTTVQGIQVAITIFLLVMAALMIPGGKLTDKYGRKRMLIAGLIVYGVGAVISAVAPGLGVLIVGNSILEGVGTAMLIPPVYILTTLLFTNVTSRARAFGAISASAGLGAAAGPLIGGVIASAISWRAAFVFQALVIVVIVVLCRHVKDPLPPDPSRSFDVLGAVLSAAGLILIVSGTLAADDNAWLMLALIVAGALVLGWFFWHVRAVERAGGEPLLATSLFRNRTANLGMVTQNIQWLMLIGTSFTVAAYLQVVRGYGSIQTGVIFTAATVGVLISSLAAQRLAQRRAQRTLIMGGFVVTVVGIGVFLAMVGRNPAVWAFAPGLLLIGLGIGIMLTPSVNVVQSSFGEDQQGEISGLSRSVSNLGSSLGTAIAGTILVSGLSSHTYGLAMVVLAGIGVVGFVAAALLPRGHAGAPPAAPAPGGSDPAHAPGTADGGAGSPRLPAPRATGPGKAPVPSSPDSRSGSVDARPPAGGQATTGGGS